jgi:hypothetical protein
LIEFSPITKKFSTQTRMQKKGFLASNARVFRRSLASGRSPLGEADGSHGWLDAGRIAGQAEWSWTKSRGLGKIIRVF